MTRKTSEQHRDEFHLKGGAYTDLAELVRLRHAANEIDAHVPSRASNPLTGLLRSNFRGRGIDFAEVRTYEPGDDVRTIDWRVTARTQVPHTKLFQEEKERPVLILVDQSVSMFFGSVQSFKSVTAAETAALLTWLTLSLGDRVGGIVFNDAGHREVRPKRSKKAALQLLREIQAANLALNRDTRPAEGNYLADAMLNVRRVARHGSLVYILSDFSRFDEEARSHFRQLARHNDIVGVHISDPLEQELPVPDIYTITNGETRSQINTANKSNREHYHDQFETRLANLQMDFDKVKCPLFRITTGDNLISVLAQAYMLLRRPG